MKKYFTHIFFIAIFSGFSFTEVYSQQYWKEVTSPTANNLWNVFFSDTLNGWIGGDSGIILHTSNNGSSWNFQNSGVDNFIRSMFFIDQNTGYALSWNFNKTPPDYYGTRILSTTNGGVYWNSYLFRDTNAFLNSIYFTDYQNGYMGGTDGRIYYTSNAGTDWHKALSDSNIASGFPVEKILFYNSSTGYAAGGAFDIAGVMWKTTDSGRNWKTEIVGPEPLNDIYIFNSTDVICVGGDFEYGASKILTTNAGLNWTYTELGVFGISRSIDFRIPGEGWIALGIVDSFLVTTDNGISWNLSPSPNGTKLFSLVFTNSRNGWAVGQNGKILKYNPDFIGIKENNILLPESAILYQNYPNPFNPSTKIRYELKFSGDVSLIVYDVLGNEITSLVNYRQTAGIYVVEFNAYNNANSRNISSGIYYYKLETDGNVIDTKRMVLLK